MAQAPAARIDVRLATEARGTVAYVTVDNRAKLNTLDSTLMRGFVAQIDAFAAREDLRALVLTGAGEKAFIGGANIPEMAALDRAAAERFIGLVHQTCDCLRRFPAPVIARIDGYALGAGLELAVSCDLRIASTRALFGMPEVKVGIPSVVEAALIPHLIGWGRARELLLTGETIDAGTALRWGLIERVVEPGDLDGEVDKIVTMLMSAGPQAVRRQKALMREWERLPIDRAIAAGVEAFVGAFDSDEPKRLLGAFAARKR
jgi:enoyl-CoA hydratase/carnithine racemase